MVRAVVLLVVLALTGCATAARPLPPPPGAHARPSPTDPQPPRVEAARAELERGQALLAAGDLAAASAVLREALRRDPELLAARVSLAQALAGLGDLDAAAAELSAALRRQPEALDARLALARVLVARQDWAAAREALERVLAAQPEHLDARFALGLVRYAQGDAAGAVEAYRRVLAADPGQHEARYNLALVLTLTGRAGEATPEFVTAAEAGHARAQYFAGSAHAGGIGVERSLPAAVAWWFRAAEQGVVQAEDALAQLRAVALGRSRRPGAERQAAEQAFADYRAGLWRQFPDLVAAGDDETVGGALLRQGRAGEAVGVLIREARALSEPAQLLLEALYEQGVEGQLPARDARILTYLQAAAAEGLRPPAR